MSCHEFQNWLQSYMDCETCAPGHALDRHLLDCSVCRELYQAAQELLQGIQRLPQPTPSSSLKARIINSALAERVHRMPSRHRLVALAAAIALMLVPLASLWLPITTRNGESGPASAHNTEHRQTPDNTSLRAEMAKASTAVAELTGRLADQTRKQARIFWLATMPADMPAFTELAKITETPLDPAAESLRKSGTGVTTSIQTVANTARQAVDYFVRELPVLPSSKSSSVQ